MSNESKEKEKKKFKRPLLHKIVNVFIGFFGILLFLLIVFFGFSQTKTFRNFLKDKITTEVSNSINGTLSVEELEGSVLSSIILKNSVVVSEQDTIININELVVRTSPIHLLLKRILVRDIILRNANINLIQDSSGEWSFSKLFAKSEDPKPIVSEDDTTSGTFPFTIQVNNISVENLNFTRQTFSNNNSKRFYKHLTTDDLRLNSIFLDAKLFANLSTSTVRLFLNNFSVDPNFQSFNLNKLSGEFEFTENYASVKNLNLITDSSNINITTKIDELNLLGGVELKDFKDYPLDVKLEAFPIKFSDLYTFIDDIDFLNEQAYLNLDATGYFGDFNVNNLELSFLNSYLNLNGEIKNLHTPEKLFLDVVIKDSKIIESEAYTLIKGLEIPLYDKLILDNLNAKFKGEPTRFHTELSGNVNNGFLYLDTYLDLQTEQMKYNVEFTSKDIDIFPIFGLTSEITGNGKIKGEGTDPNKMTADLSLSFQDSQIDSIFIDSTNVISNIQSKLLDINLVSVVNNANVNLNGKLDLRNDDEPFYDLLGKIQNLGLNNFTGNIADSSDLNLTFSANGKNLEIDEMVGNYQITLEPSYLRDINLDETSITLDLIKNEEERVINLKSDFADFNIDGQFSLAKAIDILVYEGLTISQIINKKIDELNPIELESDKITLEEPIIEIDPIIKEELEFNFDFLFKDFELIALFLNNDELDITGSGEGTVLNDSLHFEISTDVIIENMLNKKKNDILYLSNVEANVNFSRDNREVSFNKMFGTISLEGEKIYAGVELNELVADFVFNQSKLFFNTSFNVEEELFTEIEGIATTNIIEEKIDLKNIVFSYKNIPWTSYDTSSVLFYDGGVQISNLNFKNNFSTINLDGQILNDESHNFLIKLNEIPAAVVSNYLFEDNSQSLDGNVNLELISTGPLFNPSINLNLNIFDVAYNDIDFGTLSCIAKHQNSITTFDVDFNDPENLDSNSLLTLDAEIPFNLDYLNNVDIIEDDSEISIALRANNFDIGSFGNILPLIKNQNGKIESRIDVKGPIDNFNTSGYFTLKGAKFTYRQNNLDYGFGLKTVFNDQKATIDSLSLFNSGGSKYTGKISGKGEIALESLPFSEIDLSLNGDLALLGKRSQTRNSNIYGDLLIKTDDGWRFKFQDDKFTFDGNIIVDRADLVYVNHKENNAGNNNRIIYRIIEDSSGISVNNQKFVRVLNDTKQNTIELKKDESYQFDFNTNIFINNIASINFVISPDLNQKLNVETTGQLQLESIGDNIKTQGSLSLLSGSRLEFFKFFDAVGTIRFENELADPHFDIVATYIGEISNSENTEETEEVAVKLKLNSSFSELKEKLSGSTDNLSVYVGRSAIENDIPNPNYDQSNALTFIILDQLSLDLDDNQKSTLANIYQNTAFSLLGTQLTSYLNSSLGGLINNIRINKYSGRDSYKLLFSGKYNNIRYSFGGSFGSQTDYLQLSKADIKVEYLFNPNFLIRLEQKAPIIETITEYKILEMGLKYKIEF